ncbi:hypothetical protein Tco_1119519, partial [Tanacetum coccineum]
MDFMEFYKELEVEFFETGAKLMGLLLRLLELRLGKTPSRSFRPVKTSGSAPCGYVVNPLVDFLALVMAYETKH